MTVVLADFRTGGEFPEFQQASDALVNAKIAEAVAFTPETVWGDKLDYGVKYLAAHLIAIAPAARELQLADKDGGSRYGVRRRALEGTVAIGYRVTGGLL